MTASDQSQCEVLVVIALQEEYRQRLEIVGESRPELGLPIRHTLLPSVGGDVRVAFALLGEMGNEQSQDLTTQLISVLRPRLVVSLGISALVSDDWKLGDVVVGTGSDNFLYRAKVAGQGTPTDAPLDFSAIRFGGRELPTTYAWHKLLTGLFDTDLVSWNKWVIDCVLDRYALLTHAEVRQLLELGFIRDDPFLAWGPLASGPLVSASKQFKDFLKQRNRNFVALDMESAGVLQAAHQHETQPDTLIIRGISDFGDERKSELDRIGEGVLRAWSTRNALRLLQTFLMHVDFTDEIRAVPTRAVSSRHESLVEHLHRTVNKEYLEYPYTNENLDVAAHVRLFRDVVKLPDGSESEDVFAWIVDEVWKGPAASAVTVEGEPGTGKTALLSVFYWHLWQEWSRNRSGPVPVFIDLHRYNRSSRAGRSVLVDEKQAVAELRAHLQPLADLIERYPDTELLVIVDGADGFTRHRDSLASALLDICSPTKHRRIVGLRKLRPGEERGMRWGSASTVVTLQALSVDSERYSGYIGNFVSLAGEAQPALHERVAEAVTRLGLREVDLFTLNLLLSYGLEANGQADPRHPMDSMAALLTAFCRDHLKRALPTSPRGGLLERAAETTFDIFYTEGWTLPEHEEAPVFLELANRHPRIRDFLIAKHVITELQKVPEGDAAQRIGFVYPSSVNRIAKEILHQSAELQLQLTDAIREILQDDEAPIYAKAHAAYLAGRMAAPQAIPQARDHLLRVRGSAVERADASFGTPEEHQHLLLARTIYISLTYLGDKGAQHDYIVRLLRDSRWDEINRGFHLEYYQDQDYVRSEPLVSNDDLQPYPRTFQHLHDRLTGQTHRHSFEIDLHTFCSLAQHRHAVGVLTDSDRARVREVIEQALDSDQLRTEELRKYVGMLHRHLGFERFRIGHLFDDFYHIKFVKRAGWVERGLATGESVADHMYGAYLLAMFLLPDDFPEESGYSKSRIMQMLLIHDLAEARTGDVLPSQRTDAARRDEKEVFDEIAMLGTYKGMAVLRDVADLWEEYRAEATINARVAKEMDKLENLVQLYVYRADGMHIHDYAKWTADCRKAVRTEAGLRVLEKLRAFYDHHEHKHQSIHPQDLPPIADENDGSSDEAELVPS